MNPLVTLRNRRSSVRSNVITDGVVLTGIIAAIFAAPLIFAVWWAVLWLLVLLTIVLLGTFGIWAYLAVRSPLSLRSEHHDENMATISLLGENRDGRTAVVEAVTHDLLTHNPELNDGAQR